MPWPTQQTGFSMKSGTGQTLATPKQDLSTMLYEKRSQQFQAPGFQAPNLVNALTKKKKKGNGYAATG